MSDWAFIKLACIALWDFERNDFYLHVAITTPSNILSYLRQKVVHLFRSPLNLVLFVTVKIFIRLSSTQPLTLPPKKRSKNSVFLFFAFHTQNFSLLDLSRRHARSDVKPSEGKMKLETVGNWFLSNSVRLRLLHGLEFFFNGNISSLLLQNVILLLGTCYGTSRYWFDSLRT